MRRLLIALAVAAAAAPAPAAPPWSPDALLPPSSGGVAAVDAALARLSTHARLLVVGAHPDDEDNALLTWVARGLGGEAAYLSLSRGEGGQNLIGPELGVELGVLRTGELLAARRLEGARQYFARAYDFGYVRSLDETFGRWPRELLQEDAVRVVRRFKPQVVVAVFPAEERAGHGQHQASAVIAADAFLMAGDPERFALLPETPWAPELLYRRAWRREEATHAYSLAALEPLAGHSLGQIAAASRSFHRSQDMGRIQPAGPGRGGVVWLAGGEGAGEGDPFAGVDTRLAALAATLPPGGLRDEVAALLGEVEAAARGLRAGLSPAGLGAAAPRLAAILDRLGRAEALLTAAGPEARAAAELVAEKKAVAGHALAAAAGVVVDALADRETVPVGGALELEALVWPAGGAPVEVTGVSLLTARGWEATPLQPPQTEEGVWRQRYRVALSALALPTMPYYLRAPRQGDLYSWEAAPDAVRGEPLQPPPVRVRFELEIAGRPVTLEREAVYRWGDQAFGERRRPLRAVPPVELGLEPALLLVADGAGPAELTATVRSNLEGPAGGRLWLQPPGGEPREVTFALDRAGASSETRFSFPPPEGAGRYRATAAAELDGGQPVTLALELVDHPHIRPLPVPVPAASELSRFALALPALGRIGYVRGASDRVPEVLVALGLPVALLAGAELERGDLSGYDAIVVGSRAYETDPALRRANPRLLDYVRRGGLLLVQYQQYQFVEGGFAPGGLEIARPHGRVTDEDSPVELLAPEHAVFRHPNPIGEADWEGWVQERGLYFAASWDDAYQPLVALADPGRELERGSLLVARLGEGTYVYTGLSFFRQLPAGVAGAVRLFVNLLALGEA